MTKKIRLTRFFKNHPPKLACTCRMIEEQGGYCNEDWRNGTNNDGRHPEMKRCPQVIDVYPVLVLKYPYFDRHTRKLKV